MTKSLLMFCCLLAAIWAPPSQAASGKDSGRKATQLESVSAVSLEQGTRITVVADGIIEDYDAFALDHPPRIVFDLPGVKSRYKGRRSVSVGTESVSQVRYYGHPDKVRLVVDTRKADLAAYAAYPAAEGLTIYVGADRASDTDAMQSGKKRPKANRLSGLTVDWVEETIVVKLTADGEVDNYESFALETPPRIVFDLFQLKSPHRRPQEMATGLPMVKGVRYYGYPDKVRLVLDTSTELLSAFRAEPTPDGLEIRVGSAEPVETVTDKTPAKASRTALSAGKAVSKPVSAPKSIRTATRKKQRDSASRRPATRPKGLSLAQTVELAIGANIDLKSSQEGIKAAIAAKRIQETVFLPTLSARYHYLHSYEEKGSPLFGITSPQDQYTFVGTLTQPLFSGLSNINQYQAAKMGIELAKYNEDLLRQAVILAAKQAYFSLLKTQKLVAVSKQAVEQLEAHKNVANNFYQVGMIPLNDLLKAQVELANVRQAHVATQNNLNIAKSNLNLILRRDINAPIEIVDVTRYTPFRKSITYCLQTAETNRIEVAMAALDVKIKEREVKIARKDYFPSVNLQANVYARGTDWGVNGGPGIGDSSSWDVSAVASWNFWDWGRSAQVVKAKRVGLNQAQLQRDEIIDNIRLEVKQAFLRTKEAEKNIATVETAIEQAEENYRISEERYKEQMVTSTDVLDAQTLLSKTMTNYYNALYDFKISKAALHKAMGLEVME